MKSAGGLGRPVHGLPRWEAGRPAGISLVHIVAALVNWDEFWSMLEGMSTWAPLVWNFGSGKSGNPCERMQAAALR
jgi:predicted oxidoreductase